MARILSYHNPTTKQLKENLFKYLWGEFSKLDKFTKRLIVVFLLIILATPFIVNQYQTFIGRAQQVPINWSNINTIFYTGSPDNSESLLLMVADLKTQLEPVLGRTLITKNIGPNVALNKTGITSSMSTNKPLSTITDGYKWDDTQRLVEMKPKPVSPQWVQIDLEEPVLISKINLRHDTSNTFRDVIVQISQDAQSWTTIFNNDSDNSAGLGVGTDAEYPETLDGKDIVLQTPIQAQYVKLWSNGHTLQFATNRYLEVEVYGNYVTAPIIANGIVLQNDPDYSELQDKKSGSFKVITSDQELRIVGKTTIAVRNGIYFTLEKLGYRWYWADPAWHIKPSSLENISLNEIQVPAFEERNMRFAVGEWNQEKPGGVEKGYDWFRKNKLTSDRVFPITHSYSAFAERFSVQAQDPTAVCDRVQSDGSATKIYPIPDHQVVIDRAITYAKDRLSANLSGLRTSDIVDKISVPISPDDGIMDWCTIWRVPLLNSDGTPVLNASGAAVTKQSQQVVTDHVFALTNAVARGIKDSNPGKYVSTLSYSVYPNVPSFPLESNIYAVVAMGLGSRSNVLTDAERIKGFNDKGVLIGVYEYYDVWQYYKDRIPRAGQLKNSVSTINLAYDNGADNFYTEVTDNWGAKGRLYWITAQKMWNPALDFDTLMDDFYRNSFGPAYVPMKRFYDRFDTRWSTNMVLNNDNSIMGLGFRDINEALTISQGNSGVQARIWQVFYHTYWWWKWGDAVRTGYGFENVDDAKAFYKYIHRLSGMHLISMTNYRNESGPVIKSRYALTDADLAALADTSRPTQDESTAWLNESLANWPGEILDAGQYVIDYSKLVPADSNLPKSGEFINGFYQFKMIIPSSGNENIPIELSTHGSLSTLEFTDPEGRLVSTIELTEAECYRLNKICQRTLATTVPGVYELRLITGAVSARLQHAAAVDLSRDDEDQATFKLADAMRAGTCSNSCAVYYLYVPANTPVLAIGSSGIQNMTLKLISPANVEYDMSSEHTAIKDPTPGFWKINIARTAISNSATIDILGVPALLWNDPKYMLIPGSGPVQDTPTPVVSTPTTIPPTPSISPTPTATPIPTLTPNPLLLNITSGPTVTAQDTGATIIWETNKQSSSIVKYGTSRDNARQSSGQNNTLSHSVTITGLNSCTIYHYRAESVSATQQTQSEILKFITSGCDATVIADSVTDTAVRPTDTGLLTLLDPLSNGISLVIPDAFNTLKTSFQILQFNRQEYISKIGLPQDLVNAGGNIFRLNAFEGSQELRISQFDKPLIIKMKYSAEDIQSIKEDTLTIQKWNGTNWIKLDNCVLDKGNKEVSCETTSFSDFMLVGELAPTPTPTIEPTPTEIPVSYGTPTYGTPSDGGYNTPSSYGTPSYGTPSVGGTTGDLNSDGKVNIFDLSILLRNWNKAGQGDLNSDGKVNIFDLSILLRGWK